MYQLVQKLKSYSKSALIFRNVHLRNVDEVKNYLLCNDETAQKRENGDICASCAIA
jgi:hypothetical protein